MLAEYANLPVLEPIVLRVNDTAAFHIDPGRGGIVRASVFKYRDQDRTGTMTLGAATHPMLGILNATDKWTFSNAKIEAQEYNYLRLSRQVVGAPLVVEQEWTLDAANPYLMKYQVKVRNVGQAPQKIGNVQMNAGSMKPLKTPKAIMGAAGMDQRAHVKRQDKKSPGRGINLAKIRKYDNEDRQELDAWRIEWMAVQNKYFAAIASPLDGAVSGCDLLTVPLPPPTGEAAKEGKKKKARDLLVGRLKLPSFVLDPGESKSFGFDFFLGPKRNQLLKQLGQRQEAIMQFDLFLFWHFRWMELISLGIFWSLITLQGVFGNYGVAIVCITIVLRILFFPLTHRSTVISRKMQEIQPQAQEIREKYKSDPQKMQQKTWELYREHNFNPLGGCLPMLLQIPVFFALFNVLRSAIELRHAQFLWVSDLSLPDTIGTLASFPINPLAVLMGITMVLQQKVVPTTADAGQQKMMMFMSLGFMVMLYSMPSGLTLYWTINQVCSIVQYQITHRLLKGKEAEAKTT